MQIPQFAVHGLQLAGQKPVQFAGASNTLRTQNASTVLFGKAHKAQDLAKPGYVQANGVPMIFLGGDDPVIIHRLAKKQTFTNPWNPSETFEVDPKTHYLMEYGIVVYPKNANDTEVPEWGLNLSNGKFTDADIAAHEAKGRKVYRDVAAGEIDTIRHSYSPEQNGDPQASPIPALSKGGQSTTAYKSEVNTHVLRLDEPGRFYDAKDDRHYDTAAGDMVLVDVTGKATYFKPQGRVAKEAKKMRPDENNGASVQLHRQLTGKGFRAEA